MESVSQLNIYYSEIYANNVFVAGEQIDFTFIFSPENGGNLEISDIKLCPGLEIDMNNIFIKEYEGQPGYVRYITFAVKILDGYESTNNFLSVDGSSYIFVNGSPGQSVQSDFFVIDSKLPTLRIEVAGDGSLPITNNSGVAVKFIFSEAVFGFSAEDIVVTNSAGVIESLESDANDPKIYKAVFTPFANTMAENFVIKVNSNSYSDLHGNQGLGASSAELSVDTRDVNRPTPTLSLSSDLSGKEGIDITVSFDEVVTGFDVHDIQLIASDGYFSQTSAPGDGKIFTFHYFPQTDWPDGGGLAQIGIQGGGYADLAGNTGIASGFKTLNVDVMDPTVNIVTISDQWLTINESSWIFLTFSEEVKDFGLDNLSVSADVGSLDHFQSEDSAGQIYSFIFTPRSGLELQNVTILLHNSYTDVAGNAGLPLELPALSIDTLAPEVSVTLDEAVDSQLISGESVKLILTFTEAVANFDIGDLGLSQSAGTLDDLRQEDTQGRVYSVVFTPQSGVEKSGIMMLLSGDYTDLAGNPGVGASSPALSIDTLAPGASIALEDTDLARGESTMLTFTFTEAVSNFSADDVRLDGAAVSLAQFTEIEQGRKFTALYTPPVETIDANNIFSVVAGSYTDLAGNEGEVAQSSNLSIDTVGQNLFGTTGNDVIIGTAGADRISGLPQFGTEGGRDSSDFLMGLGGADVFVLGKQNMVFYNDGNNNAAGTKDLAAIGDFSIAEGDKIEVKAGTYFFKALSMGKLSGTGLYLDTNSSGTWDAKDELIGFLVGVNPGCVSTAHDLISV